MESVAPMTATPPESGYKVLDVGLMITRALSVEEWRSLGVKLSTIASRTTWAIGDWLAWADANGLLRDREGNYGDVYGEASLITGLTFATLGTRMRVSQAFQPTERAHRVPWSFYRSALRLPDGERAHTLTLAKENGWRLTDLDDYITTRGLPSPADDDGEDNATPGAAVPVGSGTTHQAAKHRGGRARQARTEARLECPFCRKAFHLLEARRVGTV